MMQHEAESTFILLAELLLKDEFSLSLCFSLSVYILYRSTIPKNAATRPAAGVRPAAAPVGVPDAAAEPLGCAKPEFAAVFWVRVPVEEDAAAAVVVESPRAAVEEVGKLFVNTLAQTVGSRSGFVWGLYVRLRGIAPARELLVRRRGGRIGGAVVVACHHVGLGFAHAVPVIGGAGLELDAGGLEAGFDDAGIGVSARE